MNPLVRTLILGALLIAGAVSGVNYHNDTVARLELAEGHALLRAAYVERSSWVHSLTNDDRYRDELVSLNKWYDASLADLHNRYPGRADDESALKELDAQKASKKLKAEEYALKKEFYDLTKDFHGLIESGRYSPVVTAITTGVRLDIVGVKREAHEGRQALRVDIAVWGAPRREISNKSPDGKQITSKMQLDFAIKELSMEFIDAKQKLYGDFKAGAPTMVIDYPERWIPSFPPGAALATYWIEPIPREADMVDLRMAGELRSPSGGPLPFQLGWKIKPQAEWQLHEGEKFEAEEKLMPAEDMDRSAKK